MLASIACVLGSGSRDSGAAVENTQEEEEEKTATYDRYLTCYAERLYQWGAQGVMAEATSHQTGAFGHRSALQIPTRQRRHGMVPYLCEQGGDEVWFCVMGWLDILYVPVWKRCHPIRWNRCCLFFCMERGVVSRMHSNDKPLGSRSGPYDSAISYQVPRT